MLTTLLVATTAIVLACAASVYLALSIAARSKAEELGRIEGPLAQATYPLTESVLRQMRGLSGAEFVLLGADRHVAVATIELDDRDRNVLKTEPPRRRFETLAEAAEIRLAGRDYFAHLVPAARQASDSAGQQVVVLYSKDQWWSVAWRVAAPIVGAGLVAILLAVGLTSLIAGWLVRPIEALREQSERIAAGQFEPVAFSPRSDELADLAASINRMTERLKQYENEVRRNERLRTLDRLGAGMAHTLRNAATGARLAIELFQRKNPQTAASESLGTALHQLELMEAFIQKFLQLGHRTSQPFVTFNLVDAVSAALQLVRPAFDHAHVRLETRQSHEPILLQGDPGSLRELVLNLLLNALDATAGCRGPDAQVVLETTLCPGNIAEIRVSDSGPGPALETSQKLFEPFVSEKPEGTGLGLYLSRQIAEAHGGTIRWFREDELTKFVVSLPRQSSNHLPTEPRS